jgi:hypothetical protein
MTASDWNWALAIVGTIASVTGVVFSWLAWVQATKAKDAAREAVTAVRIRNLSHSFSRWAADAKDLLRAVREARFAEAQRAATDLLGVLSHNRGWLAGLRLDTARMDEILRLLDFVNNYLSDETIFVDTRENLLRDCQSLYKKMDEAAGAIEVKAEGL